jgi:hypothetical protein
VTRPGAPPGQRSGPGVVTPQGRPNVESPPRFPDGHSVPPADNGAAALMCARRSRPVFPCWPGSKQPVTRHGFYDATTDVEIVAMWWTRMPTANIAVATGRGSVDVLDVDVKPDGDGFTAYERLRRAGLLAGAQALVSTRNGGLHVYFAGTEQTSARLPRHHLDFKACGGYVLAPPSRVAADEWAPNGTGSYRMLDERLAGGRLDWAGVVRLLAPAAPVPPSRPRARGDGIGRLAGWVARQPEGNRNSGLFWAGCRAIESGCGDTDALVQAATEAGLDEREALRTVASAQRTAGGAA